VEQSLPNFFRPTPK